MVKLKEITATGVAKKMTKAITSTAEKLNNSNPAIIIAGIIIRRLINVNVKALPKLAIAFKRKVPPKIIKARVGARLARLVKVVLIINGSLISSNKNMNPRIVATFSGEVIRFFKIFFTLILR